MPSREPLCICEWLRNGRVVVTGYDLRCPVHREWQPPTRDFAPKTPEQRIRAIQNRRGK